MTEVVQADQSEAVQEAIAILSQSLAQLRARAGLSPSFTAEPLAAGAPVGHLVVAPGQTVASNWGNALWDQSVNAFASAADRDNQWPAPPAAAMAYTQDTRTLWQFDGTSWLTMRVNYPMELKTLAATRVDIATRTWGNCPLAASTQGNWTNSAGFITATRTGFISLSIYATYSDSNGVPSVLGFKHKGIDVGGGVGVATGGGNLQLRGSHTTAVAPGDMIHAQIFSMTAVSNAYMVASEIIFTG
jgi:hypothetical protein